MTPKYTAIAMAPYHEQKWIDSEESQLLKKYDECKFAHTQFDMTVIQGDFHLDSQNDGTGKADI